jgi:hypothetical protein
VFFVGVTSLLTLLFVGVSSSFMTLDGETFDFDSGDDETGSGLVDVAVGGDEAEDPLPPVGGVVFVGVDDESLPGLLLSLLLLFVVLSVLLLLILLLLDADGLLAPRPAFFGATGLLVVEVDVAAVVSLLLVVSFLLLRFESCPFTLVAFFLGLATVPVDDDNDCVDMDAADASICTANRRNDGSNGAPDGDSKFGNTSKSLAAVALSGVDVDGAFSDIAIGVALLPFLFLPLLTIFFLPASDGDGNNTSRIEGSNNLAIIRSVARASVCN